ncbi:LppM family (lipo)protein [Stackebrandtia soli]|uniref:LppM family (lipo)protein n=1 Tax=Stackebrandtia soli TaxID=1892856 RepID=UPI0039EA25DB
MTLRMNRVEIRRGATAAVLLTALLFLSGCLKIDMTVTVNPDDTVDGSVTAAVDRDAIDVIGRPEVDEFVDSLTEDVPGAYRSEDYGDDRFEGRTTYFEDVPLDDFGTGAEDRDDEAHIAIVHTDDEYRLDGRWRVPDVDPDVATEFDPEVLDAAEFTVSVTFPGEVVSHNGELSGTTVTWKLRPGSDNDLRAVSRDHEGARLALIVLIVSVVLLALVALALFVQLRRHSIGSAGR